MSKSTLILAGKGPVYEAIGEKGNVTTVGQGPLLPGQVLLCVGYSHILKPKEISAYEFALNIHFGPLPSLRGCFPTKWAIINDEPAGVTLHHITPEIDAGPILSTWTFTPQGLTDADVYQYCTDIALSLWDFWKEQLLSGDIPPGVTQDESRAKYYPRVLPFGGKYDPSWTDEFHERVRRAFDHPPYPGLTYEHSE